MDITAQEKGKIKEAGILTPKNGIHSACVMKIAGQTFLLIALCITYYDPWHVMYPL